MRRSAPPRRLPRTASPTCRQRPTGPAYRASQPRWPWPPCGGTGPSVRSSCGQPWLVTPFLLVPLEVRLRLGVPRVAHAGDGRATLATVVLGLHHLAELTQLLDRLRFQLGRGERHAEVPGQLLHQG